MATGVGRVYERRVGLLQDIGEKRVGFAVSLHQRLQTHFLRVVDAQRLRLDGSEGYRGEKACQRGRPCPQKEAASRFSCTCFPRIHAHLLHHCHHNMDRSFMVGTDHRDYPGATVCPGTGGFERGVEDCHNRPHLGGG